MRFDTLRDLYISQLQNMHHAERQVARVLEKLAQSSNNKRLQRGFLDHLEETHRQIDRLEEILDSLGQKQRDVSCHAMEGIVAEAEYLMQVDAQPNAHDAALIAAAQKAEHYEIATYGTLKAYAKLLGEERARRLLEESENEEVAADRKLTGLAMEVCNPEARNEPHPKL